MKTSYPFFEVLVIDNGSVESETFELFAQYTKKYGNKFSVIRVDTPFNFSSLINQGASVSKGEYILTLNNDVEVITQTWLEEMLGWAERQSIGAVGAMLLYPDDTIQHAGVVLGIADMAGHSHKHIHSSLPGYFGRLTVPSPYTAVTGACLLVRKSLFEKVGGFDEILAVAYNDVDFCCKLVDLGLNCVVPPLARLYHHESQSRGFDLDNVKKSRIKCEMEIMRKRWGILIDNDPAYNPNLTRHREDFTLI